MNKDAVEELEAGPIVIGRLWYWDEPTQAYYLSDQTVEMIDWDHPQAPTRH
jgi:hypothetical protein